MPDKIYKLKITLLSVMCVYYTSRKYEWIKITNFSYLSFLKPFRFHVHHFTNEEEEKKKFANGQVKIRSFILFSVDSLILKCIDIYSVQFFEETYTIINYLP